MTYTARPQNGLKMSNWVVQTTVSQSIGTSLTAVTLGTTPVQGTDPYGAGITVNSSSITLPVGEYFLQASLNAYFGGSSTHQFNYQFYNSGSAIGYQGSLNTWVATTPTPLRDHSARAFLSVVGSPSDISVQGSCTASSIVINSTSYNYDTRHRARILVWRIG